MRAPSRCFIGRGGLPGSPSRAVQSSGTAGPLSREYVILIIWAPVVIVILLGLWALTCACCCCRRSPSWQKVRHRFASVCPDNPKACRILVEARMRFVLTCGWGYTHYASLRGIAALFFRGMDPASFFLFAPTLPLFVWPHLCRCRCRG